MTLPKNAYWKTPKELCELIGGFLGDFLDPCAPADDPHWTGCTWAYTEAENGLAHTWDRPVFMNPPYSRGHINRWVNKFITESNRFMPYGIALLPGRPGSRWWNALADAGCTIAFLNGRITFVGAPNAADFPSVLAFVSQNNVLSWQDFAGHFGFVATIWRPVYRHKVITLDFDQVRA